MWQDRIVEEIRRNREQYAAAHDFDLGSICRAAREKQRRQRRNVVQRSPRRVNEPTAAAEQGPTKPEE